MAQIGKRMAEELQKEADFRRSRGDEEGARMIEEELRAQGFPPPEYPRRRARVIGWGTNNDPDDNPLMHIICKGSE